MMHEGLKMVQDVLVYSTPALFALFFALLLRLLKIEKINQEVTQSSALFDGFILCIFVFGLAILVTELVASWNTNNAYSVVFLKFLIILIGLLVTGLRPQITVLFIHGVCCSDSGHDGGGLKCVLCALTIVIILVICYFAVQWVIMSSFATLLLSLAYPLHVTTLVVFHFTFVIALSVIFGVFVSEIISNWKLTDNGTTKDFKFTNICFKVTCAGILLLSSVMLLAIAIVLYIALIRGYAFIVVQRIVPADGVIHSLLFLPSVFLILIGWLLKKKYFGM